MAQWLRALGCSSRGARLDSQQSHSGSHPSVCNLNSLALL